MHIKFIVYKTYGDVPKTHETWTLMNLAINMVPGIGQGSPITFETG